MENYVKLNRPLKIVDAKAIHINGKTYLECYCVNDKMSVLAVVVHALSCKMIADYEIDADSNTAKNMVNHKLVAWVGFNKYGACISGVGKEK